MHDFSHKEFWERGTEPFRKYEQPPVKDNPVPGCPSSKNIRRKAYKDLFQTVFYEAIQVSVSIAKMPTLTPKLFFHFSYFRGEYFSTNYTSGP